ncbi:Hypothetical predicted protein [Octopus vulgaris]|uniref:Reverse transcriptase domain-containing protein n=1 Tax=Octopus vulgaris TaxID=6645 RepID=A0AA36BSZ2_OCTVU|nr:Hypothetical predicted protein [Octopus vulgaris]
MDGIAYADDLVLVAVSRGGLQALIDRCLEFCHAVGLGLNVNLVWDISLNRNNMLQEAFFDDRSSVHLRKISFFFDSNHCRRSIDMFNFIEIQSTRSI